jgi:hypothetical protein
MEQALKSDRYVCEFAPTPRSKMVEKHIYIPYSIQILLGIFAIDCFPTHLLKEMPAMKHPVPLYLVAIAAIVPIRAFAQDTEHLTRAQVREELAKLEQRGYNPGDWVHYPQNLRMAQTSSERTTGEPNSDNRPVHVQPSRAE